MPSEATQPGRLAWLRSQGLGLLCGQATVVLLGVGSVIIARTRDTDSAALRLDEIRPFFDAPSLTHWWFYLLVPVLGLYALNTVLATWDSVTHKWRLGMRSPFKYGAAVFHLAFLVSLLAHGVNGLWASEDGVVLLTDGWTPLGDGRDARLLGIDVETSDSGMPRRIHGHVEVRGPAGVEKTEVGYNEPISAGFGSTLHLLANWQRATLSATITDGESTCVAVPGSGCALGDMELAVLAVHERGHWGNIPTAIVETTGPAPTRLFLMAGRFDVVGSKRLLLQEVAPTPLMILRARSSPGSPWALAAALLMGLGVVLLGRRWIH